MLSYRYISLKKENSNGYDFKMFYPYAKLAQDPFTIDFSFTIRWDMLIGLIMKSFTSIEGKTLLNSSLLISKAVIKAIFIDGFFSFIRRYNSKPFIFGIRISVNIKS